VENESYIRETVNLRLWVTLWGLTGNVRTWSSAR